MSIASYLSVLSAKAAPWMTELSIVPTANIPPVTPNTTISETATTTLTVLANAMPQFLASTPEVLTVHTTTTTMATTTLSVTPTPHIVHTEVQGDCAPQPTGYGPVPKEDTMWGFYDSSEIHDAAANAITPPHYIQAFAFANASYVGGHYLGHYELESYDTLNCSARCDTYTDRILSDIQSKNAISKDEEQSICQGINIYFERSPVIHLGSHCPNSKSRTVIKCALWGEELEPRHATNTGYNEWNFDVVIAGSNGYSLGKEAKKAKKAKKSAGVRDEPQKGAVGKVIMAFGLVAVVIGVLA
jgi:hypothetical protein